MKSNDFTNIKKKIINLFKEKNFNKIIKLSKNLINKKNIDHELLKILALTQMNLNNFYEAEKYLKKLIIIKKSSDIFYLYGTVLTKQEKYVESIEAFEDAINLNSNFSEAFNSLGNSKKKLNNTSEAIINYKKAIECNNNNLAAYYNLGNIYKTQKNYTYAIENYKKFIELNNESPEVYNDLGGIYAILGNFIEARIFFKLAVDSNKFFLNSYKNYISITKIKKNDDIFIKLKEIVDSDKIKNDQKSIVFFSLSKAYFDIDEIDTGFKYLEKANNLKLQEFKYSHNKETKIFLKIKDCFSKEILFENKDLSKFNSRPIFILGMPRSGTSLIEQIISSHSDVFGAGELDFLPSLLHEMNWDNNNDFSKLINELRFKYLTKLNQLSDKKYIVDKLPLNFKFIGFILNAIPEAKIIHINRNPMATCWSNYKIEFNNRGMGFSFNQEYIAKFYVLYHDLMNFWINKFPHKIININYEEFVTNHDKKIKEVINLLNLKWENKIFDFYKNERPVETASLHQVRGKIYKNSSQEWKKYEDFLKPMKAVLKNNNIIF